MSKQMTAVNWLIDKIYFKYVIVNRKLLDQAIEMDMEQKRNMFDCGRQYQLTGEGTFKEVYEEMYVKEDVKRMQ